MPRGEKNGFVLNLMTDGFPLSVTECDDRNVEVNARGNQVIARPPALTRSAIGTNTLKSEDI